MAPRRNRLAWIEVLPETASQEYLDEDELKAVAGARVAHWRGQGYTARRYTRHLRVEGMYIHTEVVVVRHAKAKDDQP